MSAPLLPKLTYDPIEDFTPLTIAGFQPFVLAVSANDPIKDLKSFVAAASEAKEPLSMGVAGIGNASHYVGLMMQRQKNIRLLFVPYSGSSMLMTSLIGGEVRAGLLNTTVAMPLIKDGRIRPLGVSSEKRWRQLPDVPTFNEVGFSDFEVSAWYGFLAPAGMPADMAKKIDHDLRAALETPEVARLIRESGLDPLNWTPEEFGRRMRAESRLSYSLIEEAGLKPGQ